MLKGTLGKGVAMKRLYIIHSRGAHPTDHWYPYVKSELEKSDFIVTIPPMPDPDVPKKIAWLAALASYITTVDKDTYFVGHSVGCQAVLRFLDSLPQGQKAGGVVLVAGWVSVPNWEGRSEEQKAILNDWLNPPLDFGSIAQQSTHFSAIFSDNDPFVPKQNWEVCEKELHANVIIKHGAGHFEGKNALTLPEVVEAIQHMAQ